MAASSSLPVLSLSLLLCFLLPSLSLAKASPSDHSLTYHGGPILTRDVNLSIIWYGQFGRVQKGTIQTFIKSLNIRKGPLEPSVNKWWDIVENYQSAASGIPGKNPPIRVKVVKAVTENKFPVGKVLTADFIAPLVKEATGGDSRTVVVIFAARDVTVVGTCMGECYMHGAQGQQPYIMVGNPESECPGDCAWPFFKSNYGPQSVTLQPPSGNIGADALVMNFAAALAATVTNPYNTGFFAESASKPKEVATACPGMFGSGALPGYPGKVRIDPATGGAFNAHGVRGTKYLLPAIWNPKTSSCWTSV